VILVEVITIKDNPNNSWRSESDETMWLALGEEKSIKIAIKVRVN
jgi:hypothetical protein